MANNITADYLMAIHRQNVFDVKRGAPKQLYDLFSQS